MAGSAHLPILVNQPHGHIYIYIYSELILCRNSLVEEMVFTLGRIKTQVRPLTQGIGTRELNFQIMPRSNWDLTPENVVQDHHRAKHPDKGPRQHWKDRMSGPSPRDWGQAIYGQQVLVIPNVHSEWPVSLELMMTLKTPVCRCWVNSPKGGRLSIAR